MLINAAHESDPIDPSALKCINCDKPLGTAGNFCPQCGCAQIATNPGVATVKWDSIRKILLFFLIDAVICCTASFIDVFQTLYWSIAVDIMLAIVAVTFFVLNWSSYRSILIWHNFSFMRLLGYCAISVAVSVIVGFFADWLNDSLFSRHFSYYAFYAPYKHGKELAIFFVAVMPALFEELGYRGFLLGSLLTITEKKQGIFISAFLFGIMHTSFISLFWLIPFGLWQGYIRVKQNTIWYGVCIHFCFNFTVCITEIWKTGYHH
jgi:membrane protease YdiL (CAAX protease family)